MVNINIACVANVFVRMMNFEHKGDIEQGHSHNHDHTSILSSGAVKATVNGKETVFQAPALIFIAKGLRHQFEALKDNTVLSCVHAIREPGGSSDIVDPASVPNGARWLDVSRKFERMLVPGERETVIRDSIKDTAVIRFE